MICSATFFVEGPSDKSFIKQFIKARFNFDLLDNRIRSVEGKNALHRFKENFERSSDQNLTNVVIFDANGSFNASIQNLKEQMTNMNVQYSTFLIPDHEGIGNLEDLLENIAVKGNKFIFDCFDKYIVCLSEVKNRKLNLPAGKARIFAYLDLMNAKTKIEDRNYLDDDLWDLKSAHLNKLYDFLKKYFVE